MNDKRIQQVLDIEQQAQAVYNAAVDEAKRLPIQAEQEAQAMIEAARTEAEQEARRMIGQARSDDESRKIEEDTQEKIRKAEVLAQRNFTHAVTEVLSRVAGKE